MQRLSAQALRGAVVGKATSDPSFLSELRSDSAKAIETRFGKQAYKVQVLFEAANELLVVIPHRTDQLARAIDRVVADIGDRRPTKGQFESILVQRAWNDSAFADQLRKDPKAALTSMLSTHGGEIPPGKNVRVAFEQADECVISIPAGAAEELTDEELEAVAGGEAAIVAATVGGIVVVISTEILCS
jgi:hypothetical protein